MMRGYEKPRRFDGVALHLDKRLPIAAGIGGGSADAAAAIRLLDRHWHACGDNKELCLGSAHLGADVPVCIVSETRIGTGTGTTFQCVEANDVAGLPVLLVNPGVACPTGPVFRAWDGVDRGDLPTGTALEIALAGRNDLEAPALLLVPQIADVLAALRATDAILARMSGSGATCFAVFGDAAARDSAERAIRAASPGWWTMASRIR
jgi:4-diphosphocytidyl-2-C-methyl-D-erythritol kinase